MTLGHAMRRAASGAAGGVTFDPLGDITWFDAWWAEDPAWTNPGDGNNIPATGLNGNGSDATDFVIDTVTTTVTYASSGTINNRPAIRFSGGSSNNLYFPTATFGSTLTEPWSVVTIAKQDSTSTLYLCDGTSAAQRSILSDNGSGNWRFFAGGNVVSSASTDTNAHLFVGHSSNSGASFIEVDGTQSTATVAASAPTGVHVGVSNTSTAGYDGDIVFQGWYSGDITADGSWADFETWVTTHYGITIS
jgi:hypothetical protein